MSPSRRYWACHFCVDGVSLDLCRQSLDRYGIANVDDQGVFPGNAAADADAFHPVDAEQTCRGCGRARLRSRSRTARSALGCTAFRPSPHRPIPGSRTLRSCLSAYRSILPGSHRRTRQHVAHRAGQVTRLMSRAATTRSMRLAKVVPPPPAKSSPTGRRALSHVQIDRTRVARRAEVAGTGPDRDLIAEVRDPPAAGRGRSR